jgi:hypothetical protein
MKRMRFQAVDMPKDIQLSVRLEACSIELADKEGNIVELVMRRDFGARFVANVQTAFVAIEDRAMLEEGTTIRKRQSFASESARIAVPFIASANPLGTPLSSVLVTIARASIYEQSFGLTVVAADKLAAELQEAANKVRASS